MHGTALIDNQRDKPWQPRPLTAIDLHALRRLGFNQLANWLAAPICEHCGSRWDSVTHEDTCAPTLRRQAKPPRGTQPWHVKAPRHQARKAA